MRRSKPLRSAALQVQHAPQPVIVIGYGPAGRAVVRALRDQGIRFSVLDLNPRTVFAQPRGFPIHLGDATRREILERLGVPGAKALVVTVPDPQMTRMIVQQVRYLAPELPIVARARYRLHAAGLSDAGAAVVVDEEGLVGTELARHTLEVVSALPAGTPPGGDPTPE